VTWWTPAVTGTSLNDSHRRVLLCDTNQTFVCAKLDDGLMTLRHRQRLSRGVPVSEVVLILQHGARIRG